MFNTYITKSQNLLQPLPTVSYKEAKRQAKKIKNTIKPRLPYEKTFLKDTVIEQYRNADGQLDRIDGPALHVYNKKTGSDLEQWFIDGKLSRPESEGPAVTKKADNISKEVFYQDGVINNSLGPAMILKHADGSTETRYYHNGTLDSTNKKKGNVNKHSNPAVSIVDSNGNPTYQAWYNKGKLASKWRSCDTYTY